MAGDPSSPVGSAAFFGSTGGSSSRGDESSPASPISIPQPLYGGPVINEEQSESSPEEAKQNSARRYWSEEENLRLVSAWLNISNDPIGGNDKKYDHYWKEVTKEYNKYSPRDRRRSILQCKNHWNRYAPLVTKFNSCWNRMKSAHGSGESDDQEMERAHALYKSENYQKQFLFEYWWRVIKDEPKWGRVYPV
uniref:Myb-like domain-containing protein n=1 Tax=Arundo donax TaxID=35708 RepID=A0A0A9C2Y8_ARUDO